MSRAGATATIKKQLDGVDLKGLVQKVDGLERKFDGLERKFDGLSRSLPKIVGEVMRSVLDERDR